MFSNLIGINIYHEKIGKMIQSVELQSDNKSDTIFSLLFLKTQLSLAIQKTCENYSVKFNVTQ